MNHPFMADIAARLAALEVACLRYQFPYMERGGKRPDAPALCRATVRAALEVARDKMPDLPLLAGGKSFGGRMTSQTQAEGLLKNVQGLVFLGFPLHPPGKPSVDRAEHLKRVEIPMLFIQGTRDEFADRALLEGVVKGLGTRATLMLIDQADHSFHVPARSGRTDGVVRDEMLGSLVSWATRFSATRKPGPQ